MTDTDAKLQSEEQFWQDLGRILAIQCSTHEQIDDCLRGWLYLASAFRDQFSDSDTDVAHCAQQLLHRPIFSDNKEYVRTQLIHSFLEEDEAAPLHIIATFLLADGRADDTVFGRMIAEGCFPRLLELLNGSRSQDFHLGSVLIDLTYEMCRMERLRAADLMQVDDAFVERLLGLVEDGFGGADDPYQYPLIRVLLVLNEQYMLASTDSASPLSPTSPLTNRVIKMLSLHGTSFRTFGENIILLLNRETETSQQLLILKVLYLLFTTRATYEFFYTNDLKVLVDIIIRNLMDLPDEKVSLRHTYLRVLYPLLAHTQLSQPPHYKRDEILMVLRLLAGTGNAHFAPTDETTLRLVDRVSKVDWLLQQDDSNGSGSPSSRGSSSSPEMATDPRFLGISMSDSRTASSVSVGDVAAVMEKPGVKTPSRRTEFEASRKDAGVAVIEEEAGDGDMAVPAVKVTKVLPEVPKHRHGVPYSQLSTLHINGKKKVPPKAPPPRRTARLVSAGAATRGGPAVPGQ